MPVRAGNIPKTAGGKGGRPRGPSKLTKKVSDAICDSIRAGNYMETAAAVAGVSKDTLYEWLKLGAAPGATGICKRFSDAVQRALAEGEASSVAKVLAGPWQAHAWHLERSRPQKFGRRILEVQGQDGGAVRVQLEGGGLLTQLQKLAGETPTPTDAPSPDPLEPTDAEPDEPDQP
jgi:hypothetical protein